MAGLGVAFVSVYAVQGETSTGRLCALRLRGVRIHRHFHVIHHEARRVTASARAFMELLEKTAQGRKDVWRLERKRSSAGTSTPSTATISRA
jgi:DNA-binding transcriptional LysR family regulator